MSESNAERGSRWEVRMSIGARVGLLLALVSILSMPARSEAGWVNGKIGTIVYSVFTPSGYTTSKKYPVIMLLHGVGEVGNNRSNITEQDAQILSSTETQGTYPCIIYAPQCPSSDRWVKFPNDNWNTCIYSTSTVLESNALKDALRGLDDSICTRYSVDLDRIYIGGGSMGGYGTWDLLCRHPNNKFAAAVPVSGGGDPTKAAGFANKIAMWAFHCTEDEIINVRGSREMVQAMRTAGASPKLTEYTQKQLGANGYDYFNNHMFIWPILLEPELLPWLFSQSRSSTQTDKPRIVNAAVFAGRNARTHDFLSVTADRLQITVTGTSRAAPPRVFDIQGHLLKE